MELSQVAFNIQALKRLAPQKILTTLEEARIPDQFLDAHQQLEQVLTEVTLSREEALAAVKAANFSERDEMRLKGYIKDRLESDSISTIDVYSWVIRDVNRVRGRVNWDLVRSALELLHRVKQERLDAFVRETSARVGAGDGERLAPYLRNAGKLLLELELRQGTEGRF